MPDPEAGAEDFSRVLEEVPGCYLFLGACPDNDHDAAADNHSPYAAFDDAVMADGCLLHANLAIRALQDAHIGTVRADAELAVLDPAATAGFAIALTETLLPGDPR